VSAPVRRPSGAGSRAWLAAIAVTSIGAVAAALVTQHGFDMQPCPWCVLQRVIFVAIGLAGALGWLWRRPAGQWTTGLAVSVLAGLGVAAALWHYFVANASASCNLTLADRIVSGLGLDALLPQVFAATASCADAKVDLLGVPYPLWSLAMFVLLGTAVTLKVLLRPADGAIAATR
jgi:protein dithiol:quinone oxidoreductase